MISCDAAMETARVEISRCITGLGLRSKVKDKEDRAATQEGLERHMSAAGVKRGSVMEKVANVFCSGAGGRDGRAPAAAAPLKKEKPPVPPREKPTPPDKPSRFSFQKMKNGMYPSLHGPAGRRAARPAGPGARRRELRAPQPTWAELWLTDAFLERFFAHFTGAEVCRLAQVCRKWRDVLYQPRYWRQLRPVLDCRDIRQSGGSDPGAARRRYLHALQVRACDSLALLHATDEDLCDLTHGFPAAHKCLRWLSLQCGRVSDKGLEQTLEQLHGLHQLELSGCNDVTDAGLWACLSPRIVSLSVSDCINVADETVAAVAQLLPSLYELNLQAYHVSDAALTYFSSKQSAGLSILRLHSCWELTNHAVLNIVHSLPNLSVLSLSGCSKITDEGVEVIAENLKGLRSLDLSWCTRVTDAALEYIACDLTQLEELVLDRCIHVTDIGIGYLSTMTSLTSLTLRWCTQVRDFGLQHLCSMRNLLVLSLAGCTQLTSSGLSNLVQLRHLVELELTNCPGSSAELNTYLRENLPHCWVYD
ncbi:F-box/LRR-repeat protein 16-like [Pollicipes pollicipes]|uniref:F-box/LRR-repeat protein 16-like n=1 Tax=Pollicipes pollicipes TaxID=41117 RepID=UPI001884B2F1|nr:F-box/LRR-repeat protein 16-like [Pollicipes pollicipes]